MKNKFYYIAFFLTLQVSAWAAPLTQSDVTGYWAANQTSLKDANIAYISVDYLTADSSSRVNPETWNVSSAPGTEVLGKALLFSGSTYMTQIDGNVYLAGIYNGSVSGEFGSYDTSIPNKWEFYGGADNSTLYVGNITSTLGKAEKNNLVIRKKAAGKNFSLVAGEVWVLNSGSVSLGSSSAGCFLTNLTFGNQETGGSINLTGESDSSRSVLYVRASNITSYISEINLNNGELDIFKGTSNDTEAFTDPTVDFSSASLNVSGSNIFRFGSSSTDKMSTNFSLGDINVLEGAFLGFAAYTTGDISLGNVNASDNGSITVQANNFSIGNINTSNTFNFNVGAQAIGSGIETVSLGTKINLNGTSNTSLSNLNIYTHYLQNASEITDITLNNAGLAFYGAAYDNGGTTAYYGYDVDLSNATITLMGKNTFKFGYAHNNKMEGTLTLGDIVLASSDINSDWSIYTSKDNIYANSISTTVKGEEGSSIYWKLNNRTLSVSKDVEIAVETFQLYGTLDVAGNYVNSFEGDTFLRFQFAYNGLIKTAGTFETQGTFVIGIADGTLWTTSNTALDLGGIVGSTSGSKITTGYNYAEYAGNTGIALIALTGAGNYSTTTALVDFASGGNPTELALNGALGINKTGTGVQYLRGENMYRGQTTVSAGELYINASGSGNSAGWGIGAVSLEGGKFGAVGASSNIGKVVATDLTWSNSAMIAVDFAADGTSDLISLSGNFLKAEGDAEGQYMFDFSGVFAAEETKYQIMSWESDSTVEFTESDFGYMYNGEENSLDGYFVMENNSLYFVSVPEPAEYAAIFGMLALGLALWRRRK